MCVLHQWDMDEQVWRAGAAEETFVASVVGFQVGSKGVWERPVVGMAKTVFYWHNPGLFRKMWDRWLQNTLARILQFVVKRIG